MNNRLTFFLIALILFSFSQKLFSQRYNYIELENRVSSSNEKFIYRPQVNIYNESFNTDKKLGVYYYALINNKWGEGYGGLAIKPYKDIIVELGAGLENNPNPLRFNLSVFYKKNKFAFNQIYEYGGSGFWYNINFSYKIVPRSQIGIIFKRYNGEGLFFTYRPKNQPIVLYIAPLYDFELKTYRVLGTIRYLINYK